MTRIHEPETANADDYNPDPYHVPFHNSITGSAEVIIRTSVQFDSQEVMDSFCHWVADQTTTGPITNVVASFLDAAETARMDSERIRQNLR